jgi:hypothetical protein
MAALSNGSRPRSVVGLRLGAYVVSLGYGSPVPQRRRETLAAQHRHRTTAHGVRGVFGQRLASPATPPRPLAQHRHRTTAHGVHNIIGLRLATPATPLTRPRRSKVVALQFPACIASLAAARGVRNTPHGRSRARMAGSRSTICCAELGDASSRSVRTVTSTSGRLRVAGRRGKLPSGIDHGESATRGSPDDPPAPGHAGAAHKPLRDLGVIVPTKRPTTPKRGATTPRSAEGVVGRAG